MKYGNFSDRMFAYGLTKNYKLMIKSREKEKEKTIIFSMVKTYSVKGK